MGFTRKKFIELSENNQLKKILFLLNENLKNGYLSEDPVEWILWYNEVHPENLIRKPSSIYEAQILRETLVQKLGVESAYSNEQLLDNPGKLREICPVTVLLDNIRSPHNAGSIIRSCEAFGIEKLILCGITPSPDINPKVKRTAMNSPVHWSRSESVIEPIHAYRQNGYRILAIEKTKDSIPLNKLESIDRALVIFGNEEFGLDDPVLKECDQVIHIEMKGIKNSINVSVAAGIVLYHLTQMINEKNGE